MAITVVSIEAEARKTLGCLADGETTIHKDDNGQWVSYEHL
ncbi:hypothetical protein [Shouchella clausii]|nr:hypothetical protein [Shouchella clausii]